jgi:co-chaperonin GroES (HSP10)
MIRVLGDMLVLEPLTTPGVLGGIIIPDKGNLRDATGGFCRVLSAGPKCVLAKIGDKVHVKAYGSHFAGDEYEHEGKKVVLIRERDVTGVVA